MREIKSNLAALSAQMAVMMEEVKKRGKGSAKGEKQVSFVFRPDIGCIASSFLICCPLAEPRYLLLVHVVLW
jgi:hypothetical protein